MVIISSFDLFMLFYVLKCVLIPPLIFILYFSKSHLICHTEGGQNGINTCIMLCLYLVYICCGLLYIIIRVFVYCFHYLYLTKVHP